jgi:creatinine amidohydrolase
MEEMTWQEVRDAATAALPAVLPIGSTEQHGPHLPLNTDAVIPTEIALAAAQITPMVVAPAIHYGAMSRPLSGGGERFPGTVSLRAATLIATIREALLGLAKSGFDKLCLFNWHYENAAYLWEAADLAVAARSDVRVLVMEHPMPEFSEQELNELFPKGFTGWNFEHASHLETSIMLVLRPELVRRDLIADDHAARAPSWDVVPAPDEFVPRSGVLMKPTHASEEAGKRFLEASVGRLVEAIGTEFAAR